jgi:hydrogenase maturation protease
LANILIACLGNIFFGDDGFGVEVGKRLGADLPENVKLVDYGIRGMDLAFEMINDYDLVLLVDTIRLGAPAGAVFVLEPRAGAGDDDIFGRDEAAPTKAVQIATRLKTKPKKMLLVGCQPVNSEFHDEMSAEVEAAVDKAVEKIREIIAEAGRENYL